MAPEINERAGPEPQKGAKIAENGRSDTSYRQTNLQKGLKRITRAAFFLFLSFGFLAFLVGEIGWTYRLENPIYHLSLTGENPFLFVRSLKIFMWDILLFVVVVVAFSLRSRCSRQLEAFLGFILCLTLWNIVYTNLGYILSPLSAREEILNLPENWKVVGFAVIMALVKEGIYQYLQNLNSGFQSPLYEFFAWHHRKDAVFNLLFAALVVLISRGFPPAKVVQVSSSIKVLLLGSASVCISMWCLRDLFPAPPGEAPSPGGDRA